MGFFRTRAGVSMQPWDNGFFDEFRRVRDGGQPMGPATAGARGGRGGSTASGGLGSSTVFGGRGGSTASGGRGGFPAAAGRGGSTAFGGRGGFPAAAGRGGSTASGGRGGFPAAAGRGGFPAGRGGFPAAGSLGNLTAPSGLGGRGQPAPRGNVQDIDKLAIAQELETVMKQVQDLKRKHDDFVSAADGPSEPTPKRQLVVCSICEEEGHLPRECPQAKCLLCREYGHQAVACPDKDKCFQCGETGHYWQDCPLRGACFICKKVGHRQDACQEKGKTSADPPPTGSASPAGDTSGDVDMEEATDKSPLVKALDEICQLREELTRKEERIVELENNLQEAEAEIVKFREETTAQRKLVLRLSKPGSGDEDEDEDKDEEEDIYKHPLAKEGEEVVRVSGTEAGDELLMA